MSDTKSQENQLLSDSAQRAIPWMIVSKCLLFMIYLSISVVSVRYLGTEQYGLFVICRSIADILILICTLGMTASFIRFIPELVLHKNLAGIRRLVGKGFLLQLGALILAGIGLYHSQTLLEQYFSVAFNGALLFAFVLIICELFKTNINSILTALYQTKQLALFSLCNGILWLGGLVLLLEQQADVASVLTAQSISYGIVYLIAAMTLLRYFRSLNWRSPDQSIGYKRVFNQSGSIAVSTLVRLLMLKYTELFFLGGMTDAETVGLYDLAFSLPMMVIVFIPAAVHELFVSGFSESYVRKPECLPALIKALYKTLMTITLPIAVFGFMFSGELLIYCYGEEVRAVYELTMAFCLLHVLPLISTPLSVAIQAKEKVMKMFPALMLQLSVNIALDYVLIVVFDFGIWGAYCALLLTFVLTIPIRLYLVSRILGGVYFPGGFFIRLLFVTLLAAFCIRVFAAPETMLSIALSFVIYLALVLVLFGKFRFLKREDIKDFDIFLGGKANSTLVRLNRFFSAKPLQNRVVKAKQATEL